MRPEPPSKLEGVGRQAAPAPGRAHVCAPSLPPSLQAALQSAKHAVRREAPPGAHHEADGHEPEGGGEGLQEGGQALGGAPRHRHRLGRQHLPGGRAGRRVTRRAHGLRATPAAHVSARAQAELGRPLFCRQDHGGGCGRRAAGAGRGAAAGWEPRRHGPAGGGATTGCAPSQSAGAARGCGTVLPAHLVAVRHVRYQEVHHQLAVCRQWGHAHAPPLCTVQQACVAEVARGARPTAAGSCHLQRRRGRQPTWLDEHRGQQAVEAAVVQRRRQARRGAAPHAVRHLRVHTSGEAARRGAGRKAELAGRP